MSSTALEIPGWYIEFQAALLRQAPRPGEGEGQIDQVTAEGWSNNQRGLKKNLASCLLPASLELVNVAIVVPATTGKFIACDHFIVDISDEAKVKISYLGDNFKPWFLKGKGKIEEPFAGSTLRYSKLLQSSLDGPILTELGGNDKAETTLTEVFSLMEKQPKGEKGVLLNNGWANIFYVRDQNNVLRAVRVSWHVVGWDVRANSVENPNEWFGGLRVFSRNSDLKSSETSAPAPVA